MKFQVKLQETTICKELIFKFSCALSLCILILITSCNPTKYVPEGQTLLNENHISVNKEAIKKSDLLPYIKQKPNEKIFGRRFYLGLYNISNIKKTRWPHKWLREIGEEPVIFDNYSTEKSLEQIKSYVSSKGYFDGKISDTVHTAKRLSDVFYKVELSEPYTIRNLTYEIADTNIQRLFYFDSLNCMITRGAPYSVDILMSERLRFERVVRDHGFYGFSGENIYFHYDSTIGNKKVDITYGIKNFSKIEADNSVSIVPHSIYKVKNIYIYTDFMPKEELEGGEKYLSSFDTTFYKGYYFISKPGKPQVKYDLIIQSLYLKPDFTFNLTNTEQSRAHLLTLTTFRPVNIFYNDSKAVREPSESEQLLDCIIQLTPISQQSFKVELEGTNSAGNLGGALNLIYQHKNLFHGAELFSMKLKGAYEAYSQINSKITSIEEYGVETSLRLPEFWLPLIKKEKFVKKYNPSTNLLASFNYQNMPFYTRTMVNATFGYNWKAGNYQEHIVNPIQLTLVKLPTIDSTFAARIAKSYLAYAYKDALILGGSYSFIFNNQNVKKSKDYWFLRINTEASGNLLNMAAKLSGAKKVGGSYQILGQPFAQYVRADADLKYNYMFNEMSSIVYRAFAGVGIPYGNSIAIPFEKQYFGGGANGIRAWQVRTLGPGTYCPVDSGFLNLTADIKLEANAEYRFKLFWILEGAVFLEGGNIWTYRNDPSQPGTQFLLNKFYKDFAVGTGTGLRFDFKYVIVRVDLGMKLRDPALSDGSKWIIARRPYNFRKDFTMVFAIGYPF
jgi:outer membrane protein assembly factor BamA